MNQKTRFTNFRNINYWYQPMNGRYIGVGLKKTYRSISTAYLF